MSIGPAPRQPQRRALDQARLRLKRQMQAEVLGCGLAHAAIARGMGYDEGQFSRLLSDSYPDTLPASALPAWTREVGPGLQEWLAEQTGHALVADDPHTDRDAGDLTAAIARGAGQVVALLIQARQDGAVSQAERELVWPELQKLIHQLEAEAQHFDPRASGLRRGA